MSDELEKSVRKEGKLQSHQTRDRGGVEAVAGKCVNAFR